MSPKFSNEAPSSLAIAIAIARQAQKEDLSDVALTADEISIELRALGWLRGAAQLTETLDACVDDFYPWIERFRSQDTVTYSLTANGERRLRWELATPRIR